MTAFLLFLVLLGAWQLYVDLSGVDRILLAAPTEVASSLWTDRGLLWSNLVVTGQEVVLGLLVALVVSLAIAVVVHLSPPLRRAIMPLAAASQAIPIVLFAPTFGASRWRTLRLVEAPAALPGLLSGAKIAVAVAVIGAVLAEDAGATRGLGLMFTQANNQLETARAFAAVVVLTVLAAALFATLSLAERRLVPWAERSRNREGDAP